MIDYSLILLTNYADSEWTLDGDNYEGLTWLSKTAKPTKAALESQWEAAKAKRDADIAAQAQAKAAVLERLGITEAEAKLILA